MPDPFLHLDSILGSIDLFIKKRVDYRSLWDETFNSLIYKSVAYSRASLDHRFAYHSGHGGSWQDISLIIYWDNKPVALWPLSMSVKEGYSRLSSQGIPVLPPIFVAACPMISRKRIIKSCLDLAEELSIAAELKLWESGESFTNSLGMSEWHKESMQRDALCTVSHELYQDLRPDIADIKKSFRKSYKSLIVSGAKIWKVGVLDSGDCESVWQEFRDLHLKVSGRVTRCDATWNMQYQDIARQCAFLVWLRDSFGNMVGGGLFDYTDDEGVYSVGAYDRSLFDKPLGHVVQYRAIEELKKRRVGWYKIGVRAYNSDIPTPTDKEISIGEFKQGFASHFFPHYRLVHKIV